MDESIWIQKTFRIYILEITNDWKVHICIRIEAAKKQAMGSLALFTNRKKTRVYNENENVCVSAEEDEWKSSSKASKENLLDLERHRVQRPRGSAAPTTGGVQSTQRRRTAFQRWRRWWPPLEPEKTAAILRQIRWPPTKSRLLPDTC